MISYLCQAVWTTWVWRLLDGVVLTSQIWTSRGANTWQMMVWSVSWRGFPIFRSEQISYLENDWISLQDYHQNDDLKFSQCYTRLHGSASYTYILTIEVNSSKFTHLADKIIEYRKTRTQSTEILVTHPFSRTGAKITKCSPAVWFRGPYPSVHTLSGPPERHLLLPGPRGGLASCIRSAAWSWDRLQPRPGLLPQNHQDAEVFRSHVPETVCHD